MNATVPHTGPNSSQPLARRLGLFDATMLVMGGIVGSGIFMNPYVVAQWLHTPVLILAAWILGGLMALLAGFIWAELADRMPQVGGQYAYLREAYHPLVSFLYGWVLLLVIQTGGMAAVTVIFSNYLLGLAGLHASTWLVAFLALTVLTIINCLGVRAGGTVQSALMVFKIVAIAMFVLAGAFFVRSKIAWSPLLDQPVSRTFFSSFGAAMVPVAFAYGGWQTATFAAGEMKDPRRDLPRALILGLIGVTVLYTAVNYACLHALGLASLSGTPTPASAVMRLAMGERGANIIAFAIVVSTLGFLSQSVLTAPRVYFAMAQDGLFFRRLAWVHPRTQVPVYAIVIQSIWTMVIVFSGSYGKILSYVISMDATFWVLTAACLFVIRRRDASPSHFPVPGHPYTTGIFCLACTALVFNTIYKFPRNTLIGVGILVTGIPVYYLWRRTSHR